jgi:hypothetical protein
LTCEENATTEIPTASTTKLLPVALICFLQDAISG